MMRDENIGQLFDDVRTGSRRALARALSLVESTTPADRDCAFQLLEM